GRGGGGRGGAGRGAGADGGGSCGGGRPARGRGRLVAAPRVSTPPQPAGVRGRSRPARAARAALAVLLLAWPLLVFAGHGDAPVVFTQPLTIATTTPTETQFLTGVAGVPATIGAELRLPVSQGRVPVVVLMHGATGVSPNVRHWADILNGIGLGALIVDSFNGRGIAETSTDASR